MRELFGAHPQFSARSRHTGADQHALSFLPYHDAGDGHTFVSLVFVPRHQFPSLKFGLCLDRVCHTSSFRITMIKSVFSSNGKLSAYLCHVAARKHFHVQNRLAALFRASFCKGTQRNPRQLERSGVSVSLPLFNCPGLLFSMIAHFKECAMSWKPDRSGRWERMSLKRDITKR